MGQSYYRILVCYGNKVGYYVLGEVIMGWGEVIAR